jgi:hypothetical protein
MMLSLLAKKESKESIESTALTTKLVRIATAVEEKVNRNLIKRKATMTVMDSSMLRRRRSVVVIAEVVAVAIAVDVEVLTAMMITSTAEVVTDQELIMAMKDLKRLPNLQLKNRLPLLHQRKKKLKLPFLLRNSLAGTH